MTKNHTKKRRNRLPPLNALRAFECAARHASFTEAANELFVSQGAISRHVQNLESWLGVPLFARYNRRIELTDRGRAYYLEITPLIARIAQATERARPSSRERVLYVNAAPTFTLQWLIPHLNKFHALHPELEVRLTTGITPIDLLREGSDMAIRSISQPMSGMRKRFLMKEYNFPVCSPAYLKKTGINRVENIFDATLLFPETRMMDWPTWMAAANLKNFEPSHRLVFEHVYVALRAAVTGAGFALGAWPLITDDLEKKRLVAPFPGPVIHRRTHYMIYKSAQEHDPGIRTLCDWLANVAATESTLDDCTRHFLFSAGNLGC